MKIARNILLLTFFFSLQISVVFAQGKKYTTYTTTKRESLENIAFRFDVTVEDLLHANPSILSNTKKLKSGTTLRIPVIEKPVLQDEKELVNEQAEDEETVLAIEVPQKEMIDGSSSVISLGSFQSDRNLNITSVLPFQQNDLASGMSEMYAGMVIAASDVNTEKNIKINLSAYSSEDLSQETLDKILANADIIVGPVYEDDFAVVAEWARTHRKPIISPLSDISVPGNPYVISMVPSPVSKNEPLQSLANEDNNIVMIEHSLYTDNGLKDDFLRIFPNSRVVGYSRESVDPSTLAKYMVEGKNNIILLPTSHQGAIEDLLSKITALNAPIKKYDISVIGSPLWANLTNFTQELLFRGNVSYLSSYFYDRNNEATSSVFGKYISAYERIPSKFSMRGYDIVSIMSFVIDKYGDQTLEKMDGEEFIPIQMPYQFRKNADTWNIENNSWVLVRYMDTFEIQLSR